MSRPAVPMIVDGHPRHADRNAYRGVVGDLERGPAARARVAKPLLVEISHAIEAFALASDRDYPLVVVALFQRLSYFQREAELYTRIAAHAALTMVGVVDPPPPPAEADPPRRSRAAGNRPGVSYVGLGDDSPLSREWTVVVLSPRSGACLTAIDLETLDPDARSLEGGRLFSATWSFHRADAYAELVRLRTALTSTLSASRLRTLDDVLTQVVALPGDDRDDRTDAAARLLVDNLCRARRHRDHLARRVDTLDPHADDLDPRSGLLTERFLTRWAERSATGTLTVGIAVIRLHDLVGVRDHYGIRADMALTQSVARLLHNVGSGSDLAIRLSDREFALVMPCRAGEHMLAVAEALHRGLGDLAFGYPFVAAPASIAVTATRTRPLPVHRLRAAADTARRSQRAVVVV